LLKPVLKLRFPVIWGCDFSGVVAEVGKSVTLFQPGEEVYGFKDGRVAKTYRGTYAEYAVIPEKALARKPANLSHEQAAAIPLAASTAWRALVTHGKLRAGDRVLIHAGAGGVGVFAIQIAKALGAYVAATAGGRNQDFLRQLGADLPINYEQERFEEKISNFYLVIDGVGISVWRGSFSVLKRGGRLIGLIAPMPEAGAGTIPFLAMVVSKVGAALVRGLFSGKLFLMIMAAPRGADVEQIT